MATLSFHGGAGTVTGSRHLLESDAASLLVDCGLFQGPRELRRRNWEAPGFEASSVDVVALTHAHIDHSGYLPRLVRDGFRGPIYTTPATADVVDLLLRDSARIQEEDAEYANKKGFSEHDPALPLYTVRDAERAIGQIEVVEFGEWARAGKDLRFRFKNAGHIIGSGMVEVELADREPALRLVFSGDVGRYDAPLVQDPSAPPDCDVLVIESTYGDRAHPDQPIEAQLAALLTTVLESGGTMLVPAFAVGRSQQLVYLLHETMKSEPRLRMPIHMDSPMAIDTTGIYRRYPEESGLESIRMRSGSDVIYDRNVFLHKTREDSMRLNDLAGPRVIISSSGMMTGGRVLHHLRRLLPAPENVIVLAGYQAPGTRGWRLKQGEPSLRIHGQDVPVKARLEEISGLSAHADCNQLLRWVRDLPPPRVTYVTHGDGEASEALARRLREELDFRCEIPALGDSHEL
jgi:metallo-beta-lactamase family protein